MAAVEIRTLVQTLDEARKTLQQIQVILRALEARITVLEAFH